MKLNNKGFTVVELLATFALTMVVMVFLFEVVLELKNVYIASNVETLVKNENALIASELNRQVYRKYVPTTSCTGSSCTLSDGKTSKNVEFHLDGNPNYVTIGVKRFEMPEGATIDIGSLSMISSCPNSNASKSVENCFLKVSYVVKSPDLKEDIPFNLVLTYKG